jgi:1,4-dihydroxy-2-naphthoyl-CoA hydrolase
MTPSTPGPGYDLDTLNGLSPGRFPGLIGFEVTEVARGFVRARLEVHDQLLAPNGYLHAAVVIGLSTRRADTAAVPACPTTRPGSRPSSSRRTSCAR